MLSSVVSLILCWEKCGLLIRKLCEQQLFSEKVKHKNKQVKLSLVLEGKEVHHFVLWSSLQVMLSTEVCAGFYNDLGIFVVQRLESLYSLLSQYLAYLSHLDSIEDFSQAWRFTFQWLSSSTSLSLVVCLLFNLCSLKLSVLNLRRMYLYLFFFLVFEVFCCCLPPFLSPSLPFFLVVMLSNGQIYA